jgi:uncharacterized membrane protein YccC
LSLKFLPFGHNYWILLTILVILKPAYSLTKKRNIQRLSGTLIGIALGSAVLYLIKDERVLLGIMIVMMIGAYSLMRIKYMPFVALMTVYLLISFYLLKTDDFNRLIMDRIIDTVIGSALAFLATLLIPPKWEKEQIGALIKNSLEANSYYYRYVTMSFTSGQMNNIQYRLLRKEAYVALANLSDAFQRMLSEPENKQVKGAAIYNMVVNNHLFLSHTFTLASYLPLMKNKIRNTSYTDIIEDTQELLDTEVKEKKSNIVLNDSINEFLKNSGDASLDKESQEVQYIVLKAITEQLQYTHKISKDIHRLLTKNVIHL